MFQRKIDELFQELPNTFGIADDILIAEFDNMTETTMLYLARSGRYEGRPN